AYEKEQKKIRSDGKKEETKPATHPSLPDLESGTGFIMRGLVWGLLVALVLSGIAFLLSRLLP
ncbi:MAG TPA: hypothetical protein VJM08_14085, partial [Anaerolineales bacterium]|nr:hypothetical protein [Anaerolineales bacterium]